MLKPLWRGLWHPAQGPQLRANPWNSTFPNASSILDAHGLIERVVTPDRLDAHKLIEEFMIQANVAAAEELESKQDAAALPRP